MNYIVRVSVVVQALSLQMIERHKAFWKNESCPFTQNIDGKHRFLLKISQLFEICLTTFVAVYA